MVDVALSIFLIGTLACEIVLVTLACRVVYKISWRELIGGERRIAPVDSESTGRRKIESRRAEVKVEDIPPEVIAPSLTKPPRPEGGFGSLVSKVDDSP